MSIKKGSNTYVKEWEISRTEILWIQECQRTAIIWNVLCRGEMSESEQLLREVEV